MNPAIRTWLRRGILGILIVGVTIYSLFPIYWMVISGVRSERSLFEPLLTPVPIPGKVSKRSSA